MRQFIQCKTGGVNRWRLRVNLLYPFSRRISSVGPICAEIRNPPMERSIFACGRRRYRRAQFAAAARLKNHRRFEYGVIELGRKPRRGFFRIRGSKPRQGENTWSEPRKWLLHRPDASPALIRGESPLGVSRGSGFFIGRRIKENRRGWPLPEFQCPNITI